MITLCTIYSRLETWYYTTADILAVIKAQNELMGLMNEMERAVADSNFNEIHAISLKITISAETLKKYGPSVPQLKFLFERYLREDLFELVGWGGSLEDDARWIIIKNAWINSNHSTDIFNKDFALYFYNASNLFKK